MHPLKRRLEADPQGFITGYIRTFVLRDAGNRLEGDSGSPIYEEPLVGFASGEDPLFYRYKQIIGDFHLTPAEVLEKSHPEASPRALSVICWVLPIVRGTRLANRRQRQQPSRPWARTRDLGEVLNNRLREGVSRLLESLEVVAVAPMNSPAFQRIELPTGLCSNWSERHALYAAGMGSFGLSDGFITEKGTAMRCGSVVAALELSPSPRRYTSHTQNCPFFTDGSCHACIGRCPVGAITESGHDKVKCHQFLREVRDRLGPAYGVVGETGCGLCQTAVPCEQRIPRAPSRQAIPPASH